MSIATIGLYKIGPPAVRTAGNIVGILPAVVDVVAGQQQPIVEVLSVPCFFEGHKVDGFLIRAEQLVARFEKVELALSVDSPGCPLRPHGQILDDRAHCFFAAKFQAGDVRGMKRRLDSRGNAVDVRCWSHILLQQQPHDVFHGLGEVDGFISVVGVVGKQICRSITMRVSPIGLTAKSAGEHFAQLNTHAFELEFQSRRALCPTGFYAAQIPAVTGGSFATDPVAGFDVMPQGERIEQAEFASSAASLTMKFEPAAANGTILNDERRSVGVRTVVQNSSCEGHGTSTDGLRGIGSRWMTDDQGSSP